MSETLSASSMINSDLKSRTSKKINANWYFNLSHFRELSEKPLKSRKSQLEKRSDNSEKKLYQKSEKNSTFWRRK